MHCFLQILEKDLRYSFDQNVLSFIERNNLLLSEGDRCNNVAVTKEKGSICCPLVDLVVSSLELVKQD